jgi:hypothetical protein
MKNKVRVRMINGERWYSALDTGGGSVTNNGRGLGEA